MGGDGRDGVEIGRPSEESTREKLAYASPSQVHSDQPMLDSE